MNKGTVLYCDICGAEITLLAETDGNFAPKCCSKIMQPKEKKLTFYSCEICGSELAILEKGEGEFLPKCCNQLMKNL